MSSGAEAEENVLSTFAKKNRGKPILVMPPKMNLWLISKFSCLAAFTYNYCIPHTQIESSRRNDHLVRGGVYASCIHSWFGVIPTCISKELEDDPSACIGSFPPMWYMSGHGHAYIGPCVHRNVNLYPICSKLKPPCIVWPVALSLAFQCATLQSCLGIYELRIKLYYMVISA